MYTSKLGNRTNYDYDEKLYSLEEIDREIRYDEKCALARYRAMVLERKKNKNSSNSEILYFLGR